MKTIVVFLHAYKNKMLRDSVDSLLNNSSGSTNLEICIYDKNNLDRSELFPNVNYEHIFWDSRASKFHHRNKTIHDMDGDYFLSIEGSKTFAKDWDIKLISNLESGEILSGTNSINFTDNDHKFFCSYEKTSTDQKVKTNWIDQSFFFTTFDIAKNLPSLEELRYNGESEVLSLFCFAHNISIHAIPSDHIVDIDKTIYEYDYIPFAINHNYNYVIDMFRGVQNIFFDKEVSVPEFETLTGYSFSKLSKHPFIQNDVEYDPSTLLDDMEGERFFSGIKTIY